MKHGKRTITTLQRLICTWSRFNLPKHENTLPPKSFTVEDERQRQVLAEAGGPLEELHTLLGDSPESTPADRDVWEKQSPEAIRDAAGELLRCVHSLRHNLEQDRLILAQVGGLMPHWPSQESTPSVVFRIPQRRENDWQNAAASNCGRSDRTSLACGFFASPEEIRSRPSCAAPRMQVQVAISPGDRAC